MHGVCTSSNSLQYRSCRECNSRMVAQVEMISSAFYGTRKFSIVFNTACHWSLSLARWIQPRQHTISLIFNLISTLKLSKRYLHVFGLTLCMPYLSLTCILIISLCLPTKSRIWSLPSTVCCIGNHLYGEIHTTLALFSCNAWPTANHYVQVQQIAVGPSQHSRSWFRARPDPRLNFCSFQDRLCVGK
jgi:hypothetical protein